MTTMRLRRSIALDLVHAAEIDHHGAGHARHGVAVEVGRAGAHRDQRRAGLVGPADQGLHLGLAAGPDDQPGLEGKDEALVLRISFDDRRIVEDVAVPDETDQVLFHPFHVLQPPFAIIRRTEERAKAARKSRA